MLNRPNVMGVINVTPDSFSAVGRMQHPEQVLMHAKKLIAEGADIIDIGAEPTNPSLHPCISLQEELDRLIPVLKLLQQEISIPLSIDTSKAQVMQEALKYGVSIINDVRAFTGEGTLAAVINSKAMLCLMHMSYPAGKPSGVDYETFVPDVVTAVKSFLVERIHACEIAGIPRNRIMIDPGLGYGSFGKNTQDNLKLIKHLDQFKQFNLPILIGASRKTFIGDILNKPVVDRLVGSLAVAAIAVYNGATIIRTHDVKETVDAVTMAVEIRNAN